MSEKAQDKRQLHNPMFGLLVQSDDDLVGLLAYGFYKQNKRDWLMALQANAGRAPNEAELSTFLLAESTERRLAAYRRQAQDHLARNGNDQQTEKTSSKELEQFQPFLRDPAKKAQSLRYILGMLVLVVVMAIVFRLAGAWLFGTPGK